MNHGVNSNNRVENFAIKWIMGYEEANGRKPRDVHDKKIGEGKGCDIISKDGKNTRYIEVKSLNEDKRPRDVMLYPTSEKYHGKLWIYFVTNIQKKGSTTKCKGDYRTMKVYELKPTKDDFKKIHRYKVLGKLFGKPRVFKNEKWQEKD